MFSGTRGVPRPDSTRCSLDFGVKRLKDIAFERAIEGQLVPVFVAGKLMGFRRKRNDALLMFCLRHYGEDAEGRRTTVNYFSTRAVAGAAAGAGVGSPPPQPLPQGEGLSVAEASATSVRTVVTGRGPKSDTRGRLDGAAEVLNGFGGVRLDARAEAEIRAALEACAARARDAQGALEAGGQAEIDAAAGDPEESFVRVGERANPYLGELLPPVACEEVRPFTPGESHWSLAGAEMPAEWAALKERLEAERAVKDEKRRVDDRRRYRARKARKAAALTRPGGEGEVGPGSSPG